MSKKRKTLPDCPALATIEHTQGLFGISEDARRKIYNAACVALEKEDKQMTRTKWNRMAAEVSPDIFVPVSLEAVTGEPFVLYIAQIKLLLQHIVTVCTGYALEIEKCLNDDPSTVFDIILYNDEAQGGNVLAPVSCKKASLWYFCLRQVGWRWCDQMWHPLCLIPHNDFEKVKGGFSAITLKIFRTIMDEELHVGIPVSLPNKATLLKCELKWVISDLDSIRQAMNLKGSAAIRCCVFCRNCIKKNCGLELHSDYFQDIASADWDKFEDQTDADIFQVWDHLLEQKQHLTKAQLQTKEKTSGFNVCEKALLSDKVVREQIPPGAFLLDTMHIYWSNGIVSWEVILLYQMWCNTDKGNLKDFLSLNWKTTQVESNTQSWRHSLCHEAMFAGASYKGSASNLQAFWPLFQHFLDGCLGTDETYTAEIKSMHALRRITMELRSLPHEGDGNFSKLQDLQQKHQDLVQKAFGYECMKPKHHARIHVLKQIARCGFYVTCMAGERKHKMFKSHIGLHRYDGWNNSAGGQFGHFVIRQIWQHHIEMLKQFQFDTCLLGKPHQDTELAHVLGRTSCLVSSSGVKHEGRQILRGHVLLGDYPGIVLDAIQTANDFFVRLQVLKEKNMKNLCPFGQRLRNNRLSMCAWLGDHQCGGWNKSMTLCAAYTEPKKKTEEVMRMIIYASRKISCGPLGPH